MGNSGIKFFILFIGIVLFSNISYSATIQGKIYDMSLEIVNDVIVEVNSNPRQTTISKDGSFSFEVTAGNYMLRAEKNSGGDKYVAIENFSIKNEGSYKLDLILFPIFEEQLDEPVIPLEETNYDNYLPIIIVIMLFIFVLCIIAWVLKRKNKANTAAETDELSHLIEFIKKSNGRTTQKEIRKEFPVSEAKISLMITELEHKGKIQKIKKGKGNIIILKEKFNK